MKKILISSVIFMTGCASLPNKLHPGHYAPLKPDEKPVTVGPSRDTFLRCEVQVRYPGARIFPEDGVVIHNGGQEPIIAPKGKENAKQYTTIVKIGLPNVRNYKVRMQNYGTANCTRINK